MKAFLDACDKFIKENPIPEKEKKSPQDLIQYVTLFNEQTPQFEGSLLHLYGRRENLELSRYHVVVKTKDNFIIDVLNSLNNDHSPIVCSFKELKEYWFLLATDYDYLDAFIILTEIAQRVELEWIAKTYPTFTVQDALVFQREQMAAGKKAFRKVNDYRKYNDLIFTFHPSTNVLAKTLNDVYRRLFEV